MARDRWSARKKTKYANRVVDDLNARELRNLWRDFKIETQSAHEQKARPRPSCDLLAPADSLADIPLKGSRHTAQGEQQIYR